MTPAGIDPATFRLVAQHEVRKILEHNYLRPGGLFNAINNVHI